MTEDNVMEFCQWLISEKGIEAGNLSDYINNNEEEVLKLAQEFKKPKFKVGGKVESAAEMFKCGGKAKKVEKAQDGEKISRKEYKEKKQKRGDVKKAAKRNFGFNNAQFQTAYENAKYGFSNQGLSRRDAKLAAQRALMRNNESQFSNSLPQIKTNHIIDIDHGLLNRVAEGPKKVFIERVDPVITNSNYKINTDINWDNIGNDLELHLDPVNYGDKIFDGGQLDEVIVIGTPVQKMQRTSGDNIIDFVKNIRFAPIFKSKAQKDSDNNSDNGFRTRTMPNRFGLAHYQGGGQVYKNLRLPKETLELIVDKGDSIVMRTPNPANGSYTYIKRKGEQNWSGNRQSSMGDFEEFKKEQANAEARRIVNMFKKPAKFDDGGEVNPDGIIKQYINFGPEYKRFEDNTGRYERVATTKQDTVWRFNDYTTDQAVYTTPKGYVGRLEDIYGGYRDLTPEEIMTVRKAVESRMQNVPQNKSLQDRYRMETFMPENWEKLNK